jgi:uncharacterized RmlC-like cupin family protein
MASVRLVSAAHRTPMPMLGTPGITREQAFADETRWVGWVQTDPGVTSGWHHHGEHDTYVYVLAGEIELEAGPGGTERVVGRPGDFVHIPAGVVHREGTPPGEAGRGVVVRIGQGPTVFNVEGPEPAEPEAG